MGEKTAFWRFFHFWDYKNLKTIVYIDGFNLYYGLLKHNAYKWLDLHSLFQHIVQVQHPGSELLYVNYYTADVLTKFATRGSIAHQSQQIYHNALSAPGTGPVNIIRGRYTAIHDHPMRYQAPPDKTLRVDAWKLEEKKTDVNIAVNLYRDAARSHCEQLVLVTGDTDIAPALELIRQDFPSIQIGVIAPIPKNQEQYRRPAQDLNGPAHWFRNYILDEELAAAQFPKVVDMGIKPSGKKRKPAVKPNYW